MAGYIILEKLVQVRLGWSFLGKVNTVWNM